ncbi:hypothetical protein SRHO_G00113850 [Serrasalmus rhombeus]
MRERPSISKTLLDTEALEDHTKNMKMGILEVVKESADPSRSLTSVVNVAVVLEEEATPSTSSHHSPAKSGLIGFHNQHQDSLPDPADSTLPDMPPLQEGSEFWMSGILAGWDDQRSAEEIISSHTQPSVDPH